LEIDIVKKVGTSEESEESEESENSEDPWLNREIVEVETRVPLYNSRPPMIL
jgi:hypothetical protein